MTRGRWGSCWGCIDSLPVPCILWRAGVLPGVGVAVPLDTWSCLESEGEEFRLEARHHIASGPLS